jgi:1,2-dihydroxy-3-keto-5-methylthiopentene dioxygenase
MSELRIYPDNAQGAPRSYTDPQQIARQLAAIGVKFERWQADQVLAADATQDDVIAAYREDVERLKSEYGFQSVDVVSLKPDHPDREMFRNKFLSEHVHADFEVRFFVDGRGLFYLHVGEQVYCTLCEGGDLITVPARTTHWFDMGSKPSFKCIRLFTTPEGWVADFTGNEIAKRFPSFDQFVSEGA